jgi:hypothetical protein
MEAMANVNADSIDAVILAAGMTCFAADCDVIVMKRTPKVSEPLIPASEVVPPFSD